MRFVILGAGAVGGYFGGRLALAGEDVFFLARGAHQAALRERGLEVFGPKGGFRVRVPASDRPPDARRADVLIVTVKAYDTRSAAESCRDIVRPDSCVVTLQNGLGGVERLSEIFGAARVIGGVARVGAEVVEPGRIRHESGGRVILGEVDGRISTRLERLKQAFERANVPCELTTNLPQAIWEKLLANAVFNVIAAAYDCELGDILKDDRRALAARAIAELQAVARARGVEIRPSAEQSCWSYCERHPAFRTSTQQDLARGRPTEWEALSGAVIVEARRVGVPVPTHEMLCDRLRARAQNRRPDTKEQ